MTADLFPGAKIEPLPRRVKDWPEPWLVLFKTLYDRERDKGAAHGRAFDVAVGACRRLRRDGIQP